MKKAANRFLPLGLLLSTVLLVVATLAAPTQALAVEPNTPATGLPKILGTALVGQTLTVDTSGISDADGLGNPAYTYQWLANDADISGATDSTYTPVSDDEGKTIRVRVSFTDDADNQETLNSEPTAAVAATSSGPFWSATLTAEFLWNGYGYSTIFGKNAGELSPNSFELDDVTYTVNVIEAYGSMYIGMDKELPVAFMLEVDGERFDSRDARLDVITATTSYKWEKTGLSWAEDDIIELALHRAATEAVVAKPNTPATGVPTHQRHGPGGTYADCGHVGHRRRRRAGQPKLHLPVGCRRRQWRNGHIRRDGIDPHPGLRRRGQGHQCAGELHRRRRQRGDADQRGHRRGDLCSNQRGGTGGERSHLVGDADGRGYLRRPRIQRLQGCG